ncbi:MAG: MBL fold metallo-hydrolase [Polyangiaceae bacterium]|nr:MBL fold metallo-hydrolase [Polyangiaceae bacterium]MCW5789748.1 MBL fold metallo-hydrolase [Polyangiaceae bacterium]
MSSITEVKAGRYTIRGVSVGGVYTCLQVPEIGALFDAGVALRGLVGGEHLFLSHGHADHMGGLVGLLGIRGIQERPRLRAFMPRAIHAGIASALEHMTGMHRFDLSMDIVPVDPGDEHQLRSDLHVRALKAHHVVPTLGYQFFNRVKRLKPAFQGLSGPEIAQRRRAGDDLFDEGERLELAYVTDTLLRVIDTSPSLLKTPVLILECTFLDERRSPERAHKSCHIHLDDLLPRAEEFENEHLVLMHLSQLYKPAEVHAILRRRLPASLYARVVPFAPQSGGWL